VAVTHAVFHTVVLWSEDGVRS